MKYTTTRCSKCGYATRLHDSETPDFQIGMPVFKCPKCGNLLVDSIATEYEFLTQSERESLQKSYKKSVIANIVLILVGYIVPIVGFMASGEIGVIGYVIPACSTLIGLVNLIKNGILYSKDFTEKLIYYSLKRTSNPEYVRFIVSAYRQMDIRRGYRSYRDREKFMKEYEYLEDEKDKSFEKTMDEYEELVSMLPNTDEAEKNDRIDIHNP